MIVAIGTLNKAKTRAVEQVIRKYYEDVEFVHIDVPSGVSQQPFSDIETRQGAINRAMNTLNRANADLNFGLEGGVHEIDGQMYCCNWGAVALKNGTIISGAGAQFILPEEIARELRSGLELGPVMDAFTNTKNIRHSAGAIGIFTNKLIDRTEMFEHIVKLLIGQVMYQNKYN
ncbi:DUF84 family protein [Solibacillus sp. CAU 1738]|uniref:DUF84 family protein n=1 Tax=Solibacillus sp. CAU 1738 TaxID=3140363 RepID=UPI00326191BC